MQCHCWRQVDCPNGLDFDSTAFAMPKSYAVAADFDSSYAATINVTELDDAATSVDVKLLSNLIHGSIVERENDFM